MTRRARTPDDFDSPWKDALQRYLPFFLAFFFPDIHEDIDWGRGYESLDKEFQRIARHAKVGKRLADKLFKVWLKDGAEHWLLIHVEVQGSYEEEFPERMFDYNSAARRLYNKDVVSLAVLCDDRPEWRPTKFAYGRWGCRMELTFRIAKLIDHAREVEALQASENPFATVVLAHCKAIETRGDPGSRRDWKLRLVKNLLRSNWSKEDVRELFRLIDWMMALPGELENTFRADVGRIEEEENKMRYVTSIERLAKAEGREEGKVEGRRLGILESIALDLEIQFGLPGKRLLRELRTWEDVRALRQVNRFIKKAESLEEIREYIKEKSA